MNARIVYRGSPYLACLLACAIVNLLYFPHATVFPDEQRFLASAVKVAASGEFWIGSDRAWEMPGPALFFAPAVRLFGPEGAILPIRFAQSILLLVQCGLIAFTARRIFGKDDTAYAATWMAALYPFFLFYQGVLFSETLFNTLFLAGIATLYAWRERGMRIDGALVLASLCFVLATLTKATLTLLPPLLIAATAWLAGASWRRTGVILAAAVGLYAAFMSPWWIRNAVVLDAFVPFTTGSAMNLYLGNNPLNPHAGIDWGNDVDHAVVNRIMALPDELARQRAFSQEGLDYIKAHPGTFIAAAVKKFIRFWNVVPNTAEFKSALYSFVSAASFGPVLVLALIAAVRRRRQWRLLAPLYLIVGYFTLLHVVTIASLRYRLPLEPLLIIMAAEPLAALVAYFRPGASLGTTHQTQN